MFFPISGAHISPIYLVTVGFLIGILGGFFGVGGSFIAGPALRLVGLDWNFAVGTDLAHIVGKSVVAVRTAPRHGKCRSTSRTDHGRGNDRWRGSRRAGDSDVEARRQCQFCGKHCLDRRLSEHFGFHDLGKPKDLVVTKGRSSRGAAKGAKSKKDHSAFGPVTRAIQRLKIWPMISLPTSGIKAISLWIILLVAFVGGVFSGFLGGGAGYIRMPSMVYVLGIPTHLAVGTDLFEIIISASYGTFSHAVKGNVDILIALVMHTGAAIGAQIGAISTQYFAGPKIRLAFVPLPLIGAAIVIYTMFSGHKL